jgi:hypothetical protein
MPNRPCEGRKGNLAAKFPSDPLPKETPKIPTSPQTYTELILNHTLFHPAILAILATLAMMNPAV